MLLEMAVADAYAIGWEFAKKDQPAPIDLSSFVQHPTYLELKPGQYTDDTQRAIGNALAVIYKYKIDHLEDLINPMTYAGKYLDAYWQDPREGYSRGYQAFLKATTDDIDFVKNVSRTKSSNGSVMGVAPLGYIHDIKMLKLAATIQAITTHHPVSAVHAQLVALSAHYFIHMKKERAELVSWLMMVADWEDGKDDEFRWEQQVNQNAKGLGTSIKASSISAYMAYAVTTFDKLTDIIKDATQRGGDTDSAAAVAVAVASCCPDIENDLPQHLIDALDVANPHFGVKYLTDLDNGLKNLPVRG